MPARRALLVAAPLLLSLSSCCTLSRLFCGPDDSRWVSIAHDTPEATVATLLEAIRRDAPEIVVGCLSAALRRQNGLDSVTAQLAWEQLEQQVPGLHLAGYAKIPPPESHTRGSARFVIDVEGHRLRIDLVQESFREIVYERPGGMPAGRSLVPLASWSGMARVEWIDDPDFDKSRLTIEPLEFEHEGLDAVPLDAIRRAGLIRLWRVAALRTLEE